MKLDDIVLFDHSKNQRLNKWYKLIECLDNFVSGELKIVLSPRLCSIARIDCFIAENESKISRKICIGLSDLGTLSHLWVLEASEVLRILGKESELFKKYYLEIKKIRVAIAKIEKANSKGTFGFHALNIIHHETGKIGWINEDEEIFIITDFTSRLLKEFKNCSSTETMNQ